MRLAIEEEKNPAPAPAPSIQPNATQPRIVHIDLQCDSCRSYGESVADAIKTAIKQSNKCEYAYFWPDTMEAHVVVAERDGTVYIDLLAETGTRRTTLNVATFQKSGDMLDANTVADEIYSLETASHP